MLSFRSDHPVTLCLVGERLGFGPGAQRLGGRHAGLFLPEPWDGARLRPGKWPRHSHLRGSLGLCRAQPLEPLGWPDSLSVPLPSCASVTKLFNSDFSLLTCTVRMTAVPTSLDYWEDWMSCEEVRAINTSK